MSSSKDTVHGGSQQRRRVDVLAKAIDRAGVVRKARQSEARSSASAGDQGLEVSQLGTALDPEPVERLITAEDLVTAMMGILHQQHVPRQLPPLPPAVRTAASVLIDFCQTTSWNFTSGGDPVWAERQTTNSGGTEISERAGSAGGLLQQECHTPQLHPFQQHQSGQGRKRTRDSAGLSGSGQSSRVPQSSTAVPRHDSGPRCDIVCFGCNKQGHTIAQCRYIRKVRKAEKKASTEITCHQCGQPGHVRRRCPQIRGQRQTEANRSQQVGALVPQYQQQGVPALHITSAQSHQTEYGTPGGSGQQGATIT